MDRNERASRSQEPLVSSRVLEPLGRSPGAFGCFPRLSGNCQGSRAFAPGSRVLARGSAGHLSDLWCLLRLSGPLSEPLGCLPRRLGVCRGSRVFARAPRVLAQPLRRFPPRRSGCFRIEFFGHLPRSPWATVRGVRAAAQDASFLTRPSNPEKVRRGSERVAGRSHPTMTRKLASVILGTSWSPLATAAHRSNPNRGARVS